MIRRTQYTEGMVVGAVSARLQQAVTAPPLHYTEATILDDMIGAHKFATDPQDREILKSIAGIGTSRTRDVIIKGLIDRGFLEKSKVGKKHVVRVTAAARSLLAGLPDIAKSPVLSAKWELALRIVAEGKATADQLGARIDQTLKTLVPEMLRTKKTP